VNPRSENEAVTQYRPFVLKEAQRFSSSGVAPEDLIQEGLIAVSIAFRTWREDGGANFLTWIRRPVYYAMLKLAREHRRRGGSFRGAGRGPRKGEKSAAKIVSLDATIDDRCGAKEEFGCDCISLHDAVGTFEEPADPFIRGRLPGLVSSLEKRERQVLRLRFEKGLAYTEVGARLKISRELARQIEQKALERLKDMMMNGEEGES
jgi:RNA polymerase sigma factor (sigma-70 family)